ncbi:MAG: 5-bromo-4-chloroindolyl phosphate hydrolysis family protein [Lachnospiraceae bacterium]|nr:5-bromo-4-chloroindolyl phosphate hydrolysis family protein [Lachnospiraceae bacterium]
MNINDFYGAGSDIMDAVNEAVRKNDYSALSSTIRKTVKEVSDTIARDVREYNEKNKREDVRSRTYRSGAGQGGPNRYGDNPYRRYSNASASAGAQRMGGQGEQPTRRYTSQKTPFFQKLMSKQPGLGKIVGSIFGLFISVPMLLGRLFDMIAVGITAGTVFGVLAMAIIVGACAYLYVSGKKDNELAARYYEYGKVIGTAEYIDIEKLARATGRTKEEVLADIKLLMKKNVFSQAWLDEQETTLMLTKEIYDQYEEIRRQSEELRRQAQTEQESDQELPENAREIIKEGTEYIRTIHDLNDEIPGVEMSEKLYRLESTMNRIVEQVRKNPGSAPELRKLMSYYLPTTVKLLGAYKELDKQTVGGENIDKTKKEIEDALDTINEAFEKLLDSLFQSMAWDVSSDISVMQTMFAQDGLTGEQMTAQGGQSVPEMEQQVYGTTLSWGDEEVTSQGQAQAQAQTKPEGD